MTENKAIDDFEKAVRCLAIELPEDVYHVIAYKWGKVKEEYAQQLAPSSDKKWTDEDMNTIARQAFEAARAVSKDTRTDIEKYQDDIAGQGSWEVPEYENAEAYLKSINDEQPAERAAQTDVATDDDWISVEDRLPELKEGEDFSENVFALVNSKLMVMAYCWIDCDEDSGYAWCNCNGDINGDPEFDDDYKVTHWQPFPEALEPKPQKQ